MRATLENTRAQGRPGAGCTRGLVCSVESTRVSHHRSAETIRPSLRDGVTAYERALPGVHDLVSHRRLAGHPATLSTSSGVPGPHAFAVRIPIARPATGTASIAFQPNARDGRDAPLLRVGTAGLEAHFSGKRKCFFDYRK